MQEQFYRFYLSGPPTVVLFWSGFHHQQISLHLPRSIPSPSEPATHPIHALWWWQCCETDDNDWNWRQCCESDDLRVRAVFTTDSVCEKIQHKSIQNKCETRHKHISHAQEAYRGLSICHSPSSPPGIKWISKDLKISWNQYPYTSKVHWY